MEPSLKASWSLSGEVFPRNIRWKWNIPAPDTTRPSLAPRKSAETRISSLPIPGPSLPGSDGTPSPRAVERLGSGVLAFKSCSG